MAQMRIVDITPQKNNKPSDVLSRIDANIKLHGDRGIIVATIVRPDQNTGDTAHSLVFTNESRGMAVYALEAAKMRLMGVFE